MQTSPGDAWKSSPRRRCSAQSTGAAPANFERSYCACRIGPSSAPAGSQACLCCRIGGRLVNQAFSGHRSLSGLNLVKVTGIERLTRLGAVVILGN